MARPIRRVVTGHDASGKSIVLSDGPPPQAHPMTGPDVGADFVEIWHEGAAVPKLTATPAQVIEEDREQLRAVGLSTEDIFDLADTVAFYNMSNRMAIGTDMIPNREYHGMSRPAPFVPPASK